ncbi:MAG: lipoprotein signal peptidase [Rikenellaceae bacterium]
MKTNNRNLFILLSLLLIIDQISKFAVKLNMTLGESFSVCGDWFQIYFIENPGAAFGMSLGGVAGKIALTLFRFIAISFLIYYITKLTAKERNIQGRIPKGVFIALVFITAGAAGNLIDSLFYGEIFSASTTAQLSEFMPANGGYAPFLQGKVVDMLYFPIIDTTLPEWMPIWGGEHFLFFSPIFNLADSYITCAFAYLLLFQRKFFNKSEVK